MIEKSVELAKAARDEFWSDESARKDRIKPLVAGSVGPYGACLDNGEEFSGNYDLTEQEYIDWHRPRISALVKAGADLLACETNPSLQEVKAIIKLLASEFPETPAWITFSCKDGERTNKGDSIMDCATELSKSLQVVAIGANCTAP